MSSEKVVNVEKRGNVAVVTVDRPKALNALDRRVIRELTDAIRAAGEDSSVASIVVAGEGEKAFVAGADIAEMRAMSPLEARQFAREGQALGDTIDASRKPVVAAVQGFALGGGCELAMACHLRVASPRAKFGQPEVNLGPIPGFGGTQRLTRLVGEARALDLILTGRMIDAATAESWGLVNRIVEDVPVVDAAVELCGEIAGKGPLAVELAIEAVRTGASMPLDEALELEAALFSILFSTEDMKEGTGAFLEKRAAKFSGR